MTGENRKDKEKSEMDIDKTVSNLSEYCDRGLKLTAHFHLVPTLSMSGAIPSLPHVPLWRAQGQLCFVESTADRRSRTVTKLRSGNCVLLIGIPA
jgi:hypothetical protein